MKIRIELEIGDIIIADEFVVAEAQMKMARWPDGMLNNVKQELWNRMSEARQRALTDTYGHADRTRTEHERRLSDHYLAEKRAADDRRYEGSET